MALTPSSGWSKYSDITVGSPSSDYQMKIDLRRGGSHLDNDPANGILYDEYGTGDNGCYYPDMRDVQVNSTDDPTTGTRLPQWTEEVDSGVKRVFWVKTNGASHIYIFVGNSSASEYSDGANTFIYFNDCESTTGWTKFGDDADTSVTLDSTRVKRGTYSLYFRVDYSSGFDLDMGSTTVPDDAYFEFDVNGDKAQYAGGGVIIGIDDATGKSLGGLEGRLDDNDNGGVSYSFQYYTSASQDIGVDGNYDTWYKVGWLLHRSTSKFDYYIDDTLASSDCSYRTSTTNHRYFKIAQYAGVSGRDWYLNIDTIRVRKYSTSPPSFTNFGAWTNVGGVSYSDSGIRYYDGTAVQAISMYSDATTSALRFYDGTNVKHIPLVDINDANASPIRVYDGTSVKALRKQ